jgi:hypothetical protein
MTKPMTCTLDMEQVFDMTLVALCYFVVYNIDVKNKMPGFLTVATNELIDRGLADPSRELATMRFFVYKDALDELDLKP